MSRSCDDSVGLRVCLAGIILLGLGSAAVAQSASAPADLPAIVRDLAADDFAVRQAAQKRLEQISWRFRDGLKKLADQTADAEAKARLLARVDAIDEQLATDPPPITLEVQNATLPEVAAALSRALGVTIEAPVFRAAAEAPRYTLRAVDQPFWEVFRQLTAQHRMAVTAGVGGVLRITESPPGLRDFHTAGAFAFYALEMTRYSAVDPQRDAQAGVANPRLTFRFEVAADPRVRIVQASAARVMPVMDDAGTNLFPGNQGGAPAVYASDALVMSSSLNLAAPLMRGARVPLLTGDMTFVIGVGEEKLAITDVAARLGQDIRFGSGTLKIARFEPSPDRLEVTFTASRGIGDLVPQLRLFDGTGRPVYSGRLTGNFRGMYAEPITVELTRPLRSKMVRVPFEFKDLVLP